MHGQTFHHGIPRIAHQRITETAAPPHHYRHTYLPREYDPVLPLVPSRPYTSAFLDELDHNPRISLLEDQLTRMRHDTAALSDRLHGRPAPGARPRVTAGYSSYSPAEYTPPPRRPRNYLLEMPENVYTAVIRPLKCVMNDVYTMAHYYTMPKMPPPNQKPIALGRYKRILLFAE
ncbi:unnamed protein product [Darwinula stevensoni]|uniref:Uncharacterized protein n=1 Tax=Darwinula stevensoni TaxID=69355 RepID=A0A7R8X2M0_9CRUS|nr:unnamed protein product [Darwinula stevensoni]CAG0881366.1 unnamed protein product [Darwinula stevensoni]